jgi:hypothetical protein
MLGPTHGDLPASNLASGMASGVAQTLRQTGYILGPCLVRSVRVTRGLDAVVVRRPAQAGAHGYLRVALDNYAD